MTIATEITYLQTQLANIRDKISKIAHLRGTEEGSTTSRFSAQYTQLKELEASEHKLQARLNTLQGYTI